MLAELKIENVAVIEKAEVQFTPGLNVLTGETGAGKSIMIDSINAILGNRTSRDLVRSGAPKARIWATFESIPAHVREQVEKCGYGAQDDLLLYREISADGKGSCRINGMPATAGVVRDISAGLLTIHGQHDSTRLDLQQSVPAIDRTNRVILLHREHHSIQQDLYSQLRSPLNKTSRVLRASQLLLEIVQSKAVVNALIQNAARFLVPFQNQHPLRSRLTRAAGRGQSGRAAADHYHLIVKRHGRTPP